MYPNDVNQYEKALLRSKNMKRRSASQIEQWLILSDNIVYIRSEEKDIMNGIGKFVIGKLMNGEECQILLDTGVSKLYMSKAYYLKCKFIT